jgi:hypothetical protein
MKHRIVQVVLPVQEVVVVLVILATVALHIVLHLETVITIKEEYTTVKVFVMATIHATGPVIASSII